MYELKLTDREKDLLAFRRKGMKKVEIMKKLYFNTERGYRAFCHRLAMKIKLGAI